MGTLMVASSNARPDMLTWREFQHATRETMPSRETLLDEGKPVDALAPGPATLRGWIARAASASPDKPYLVSIDDERVLTYRDLEHVTEGIAAMLRARGIGPGRRVALLANNSLEHLALYLGVLTAGATICTVHVEMNRSHLPGILAALSAELVIYDDLFEIDDLPSRTRAVSSALGRWSKQGDHQGIFAELAATPANPAPVVATAGDAVIFFTSGTSALPKGVVLTHRELLQNANAIATAFGIGPDDRIHDHRSFNWASAQLLSALGTLSVGATLLLARKFSRSRFFPDIQSWQATVAAGNPTLLNLLMQGDDGVTGSDLPYLRFITSSSAPLLLADWRRFEDRFKIPVVQGYGTSETGWIAGSTAATQRHGTVGKPLPYLQCAIVADDGTALPTGEIGRVEVGVHPGCAYRYLSADGTFRVHAKGRLRTGDLGFLDAEGYLHLTGREKDLIIRGGVNISPLEIDNVLLELPQVEEAATIGVPDAIWGEEVVSIVVLKSGQAIEAAEILAFCSARLPAAKAPKRIEFATSLPKTERGKLDRKALAAARFEAR
jgi:acyl-CoA synthetase (AMP-forming)/AMP-acid ligase II